jgi:HPt (histidine-containing phosphotransfer) domain-containing protein
MQLDSAIRRWVRDKSREEPPVSFLPSPLPKKYKALKEGGPIPGVDAERALFSIFGGDWEAYMHVLRSYVANTPAIIDDLRRVTEETLLEYVIAIHGLKGASGSIGAENTRKAAAKLETMARTGNLAEVLERNETFLKSVESLVTGIQNWLEELDTKRPKPRRHAPERALLDNLRQSCEKFDMDGIDKIMYELENASYDTDGSLVTWLREKIDTLDFSEAAIRIAEYEEGLR